MFKLKENNTTASIEVMAGITTFMTMAYILIVNPDILSAAGMSWNAVFTATVLASIIGTLCMGLFANYPFALAPGMGLNAFFAFTVASRYGWQMALVAVFIEGVIFILLSFFNVREAIFDSIPKNLKSAVSVGIGLFIAFIGFKNAGIIVQNPATAVGLGDLRSPAVYLSLVGIIISVVMVIKKVKGALLFGILSTYVLGVIFQLIGIYVPNPEAGLYSLLPTSIISMPPSLAGFTLFDAMAGLGQINILDLAVVVFTFLFVDVFDTIGTLIGVSTKAKMLDKNGKLPRIKQALLADAVGTTVGAVLGTSTVTTYIESAAGVAEGARTGLASVATAACFALALLFSPLFSVIPAFATAPALIVVGVFMMESVTSIDFSDFSEGVPAFMAIVMMPFASGISDGLIFGVLSYVLLKALTGKAKELNPIIIIIGVLFFLKLVLH